MHLVRTAMNFGIKVELASLGDICGTMKKLQWNAHEAYRRVLSSWGDADDFIYSKVRLEAIDRDVVRGCSLEETVRTGLSSRGKRAFLAALLPFVPLITGGISLLLGIYSSSQVSRMAHSMEEVKQITKQLVTEAEVSAGLIKTGALIDVELKDKLAKIIKVTSAQFYELEKQGTKELLLSTVTNIHLDVIYLREKIESFEQGLFKLYNGKFPSELINLSEIYNLYLQAGESMKIVEPFLKSAMQLNHFPTTFEIEEKTLSMSIFFNLPLEVRTMTLYKHLPFPIYVGNKYVTMQAYDGAEFIAVDDSVYFYKEFTSSTLKSKCFDLTKDQVCYNIPLLIKNFEQSCLGNLYKSNLKDAARTCRVKDADSLIMGEQVSNDNEFALYSSESSRMHINCNGQVKSFGSKDSKGFNTFDLPPGCQVISEDFVLEGINDFLETERAGIALDKTLQKELQQSVEAKFSFRTFNNQSFADLEDFSNFNKLMTENQAKIVELEKALELLKSNTIEWGSVKHIGFWSGVSGGILLFVAILFGIVYYKYKKQAERVIQATQDIYKSIMNRA